MEGEEDQGERVHQDQENVQRVDSGSSLSPVWHSLIRHLEELIVYDI